MAVVMGSVVVRLPVPELGPKTTGPKLLVPSGWVLECHTGSSLLGMMVRLMVWSVAVVAGVPVPPPASVTLILKLSLVVSLPSWS